MIAATARHALEALLGPRVEFDAPLARHTSLRIGGPADALASPANREELAATLAICAEHALPSRVLGGGFNVITGKLSESYGYTIKSSGIFPEKISIRYSCWPKISAWP